MTTHKPGCGYYTARLTCDCGKNDYDRGAREAVALYRKELAEKVRGLMVSGRNIGFMAVLALIEADVESAAPEGAK